MAKRPSNTRGKIIDAALKCAAETRWRVVSLSTIAETAGISLSQLYTQFPSKTRIVEAVMERTTGEVVAGTDPSAENEPAHDRLLDAILRRFDAMEPNKSAIISILKDLPTDPARTLCLAPSFLNSMAWTLESAGISSSGVTGKIRTKGLAAIYLATLTVWMRDDSQDLSKTTAFVDRRLNQATQLAAFLPLGIVERSSDNQSE